MGCGICKFRRYFSGSENGPNRRTSVACVARRIVPKSIAERPMFGALAPDPLLAKQVGKILNALSGVVAYTENQRNSYLLNCPEVVPNFSFRTRKCLTAPVCNPHSCCVTTSALRANSECFFHILRMSDCRTTLVRAVLRMNRWRRSGVPRRRSRRRILPTSVVPNVSENPASQSSGNCSVND
jgi:hypothetical protein